LAYAFVAELLLSCNSALTMHLACGMASILKSCSFALLCGLVVSSLVYFIADPALSRVWDVEMVSECESDHESAKEGQSKGKSLTLAAICTDTLQCLSTKVIRVSQISEFFLMRQRSMAAKFSRGPPLAV